MSIERAERKTVVSNFSEDLYFWSCRCDFCGSHTKKRGDSPGDASDVARKEGFQTVSIRPSAPMKWRCYTCSKKKETKQR